MTNSPTADGSQREPELVGQTVVVIGGSAGIGLETARKARAEGAEVVLTGRNPDRLAQAAQELRAQRTAAFDATDADSVDTFFQDLPTPIDHVLVTAGGPTYGPLLGMSSTDVRQALTEHIVVALDVARNAVGKMRPGGTLLLVGGTGGRRISRGRGDRRPHQEAGERECASRVLTAARSPRPDHAVRTINVNGGPRRTPRRHDGNWTRVTTTAGVC